MRLTFHPFGWDSSLCLTINKKNYMFAFIKNIYTKITSFGCALEPFLLLAMRLFWGGTLMMAGWGKLHHIADTSHYFASLKIPFPLINAYLVGGIECAGGFCLLAGFLSQLAAIPVICVMLGALLTAHRPALLNVLNDPQNLIVQAPFNYLLTALIILAIGPGIISLDYLIGNLGGSSPKAAPKAPKPKP